MLSPGRLHTSIMGSDPCLAFVPLTSPKCALLSIIDLQILVPFIEQGFSSMVCLNKLSHTINLETRNCENCEIPMNFYFYCLKFDSS